MIETRLRVLISGRVQGVFFRASTRSKAEELGLAGWVRNMNDGRVEAVFEGSKATAEEALAWCRQGPPGSLVKKVEASWHEPTGEFTSFTIRY
jgi:acylphosphatase